MQELLEDLKKKYVKDDSPINYEYGRIEDRVEIKRYGYYLFHNCKNLEIILNKQMLYVLRDYEKNITEFNERIIKPPKFDGVCVINLYKTESNIYLGDELYNN